MQPVAPLMRAAEVFNKSAVGCTLVGIVDAVFRDFEGFCDAFVGGARVRHGSAGAELREVGGR